MLVVASPLLYQKSFRSVSGAQTGKQASVLFKHILHQVTEQCSPKGGKVERVWLLREKCSSGVSEQGPIHSISLGRIITLLTGLSLRTW